MQTSPLIIVRGPSSRKKAHSSKPKPSKVITAAIPERVNEELEETQVEETVDSVSGFAHMNLPPLLLKAMTKMNYQTPTPIQEKTIPAGMAGKDILGCAQTGTGKTAAFLIPMITQILKDPKNNGLILAPTRELAAQIQTVLTDLTAQTKHISHALLIGGMSMQPQVRALQKKPKIIIATPGRLLDHLDRRGVSLQSTHLLVLDEADRMLDMGFAPQLRDILKMLPAQRQTFLFTATLPKEIKAMTKNYLKNPVEITIGQASKAAEKISQKSLSVSVKEKNDVLVAELNQRKGSIIIFSRTQRRADRLHRYLASYGHEAGVIHGGKTQGQRNRALQNFRDSETRILVATDIAARGLDIPHVAHVINYDLPSQAEDYIHRIGRTARAGAEGHALSLIVPEEKDLWKEIQKLQKLK